MDSDLSVPLTRCAVLGKFLPLSTALFLVLKMGMVPFSRVVVKIRDDVWKVLSTGYSSVKTS